MYNCFIYKYYNDILGSQVGSLTVTDRNKTVLLQKHVQADSPTIVLPHPVLTDQLNMQFSYEIYITEIEVFGGKPQSILN